MQLPLSRIAECPAVGWVLFLAMVSCHALAEGGDPPSRWTVQKSGAEDDLKAVRFVTPELGWAVGAGNTVLHTQDGGKTWARQLPRDSNGVTFDDISFLSPKVGWVRTRLLNKIIRTTDGGTTWNDVPIPDKSDAGKCFTRLAAVGSTCFVQCAATLYRTDDGKNWIKLNDKCPDALGWGDLWFADKDHGCGVVGNGLVAMTADGGKTWQEQRIKTTRDSNYMKTQFIDLKIGWLMPQYGTVHATMDGGKTWKPQKLGHDEFNALTDMQFASAKVGHVLLGHNRGYAVRQTEDGGDTWQELDVLTVAPSYVNGLSFPDAENGWVVGDKGFIARYQAPSKKKK